MLHVRPCVDERDRTRREFFRRRGFVAQIDIVELGFERFDGEVALPAYTWMTGQNQLPVALARRRSFGAVGVVVLASGVLIGAAVGPAIAPSSLASGAGQLIVVAGRGAVPAESVPPLGLVTKSAGEPTCLTHVCSQG